MLYLLRLEDSNLEFDPLLLHMKPAWDSEQITIYKNRFKITVKIIEYNPNIGWCMTIIIIITVPGEEKGGGEAEG